MKFRFQFLLSNGTSEWYAFTASTYNAAFDAAFAYSRLAFREYEILDFYWKP